MCFLLFDFIRFQTFHLFDGWTEGAQFDEIFGAPGVLFSALAFVGVILAIIFQTIELRTQREEIEHARNAQE